MTVSQSYVLPLVGAHFRPPAKPILSVLPMDTPLTLIPEPTNEFDPNAIMVQVATEAIPESTHAELGQTAEGFGWPLADILALPTWHLGYIPRTEALWLAPRMAGQPIPATLGFDAKGKPVVRFTLEA